MVAMPAVLMVSIACASSSEPPATPNDKQLAAQQMVKEGHPELSLPIYDELTLIGSNEPKLYQDAVVAATGARDFRRAALYGERRLQVDPDDFAARERLAFSYHMAGDVEAFNKARASAFQYRLSTNDPRIVSNRLMIDLFDVGNFRVFTQECYKRAGPLRIKYRFDVRERDPNAPGGMSLRSYLVLENRESDDEIAKEHGDIRPRFFLDAFENNKSVHKTIQPFIGEPSYDVVKARVAQYLQDNKIISASTLEAGHQFNADCSAMTSAN